MSFFINYLNNSEVKLDKNGKFEEDKALFYYENGDVLVQDGVVLNKKDLCSERGVGSLVTLVESLCKDNSHFFSAFKGSFSGGFYDKEKNTWTIYTNQWGDGAVFYYVSDKGLIVSSSAIDVIELLNKNNISTSLDETAVYYMLTYGFMGDERTYAKEIKRLLPGQYLTYDLTNHTWDTAFYYQIKTNKLDLSKVTYEQAIEDIDRLFRASVKREFEKDVEYGYRHLCELSGGLDSRMTFWVAHELGFKNVLAYTFGQANCSDEIVAKQIADYWHEEIMVWPSNAANFMMDIDELVKTNYGSVFYYGAQMESRTYDLMDMSKFGGVHTGQIGDVVIGSFLIRPQQRNIMSSHAGAYSDVLFDNYEDESTDRFGNLEEQLMLKRGLLGCCSSHFVTRKYTEVFSPFMDTDLMDYCLSLPLEWRVYHGIYKKWVCQKYPDAAKIKWASTNTFITRPQWAYFLKRQLKKIKWVIQNPGVILKKIGIKVKPKSGKHSGDMTPLEYWYNNLSEVNTAINNAFDEGINKVGYLFSEKLKCDLEAFYKKGNASDKTMVVSALKGVELYFGD